MNDNPLTENKLVRGFLFMGNNEKREIMEIFNTKQTQLDSLMYFAAALGCCPKDITNFAKGFYCPTKQIGVKHISLENMCRLHNQKIIRISKYYPTALGLTNLDIEPNVVDMMVANKRKIVEQVKLQRCKSEPDGVRCQNHFVRYIDKGE
ncbi:hypothetical protein VPHG_00063 [Vibrio phage 11895-B1]|uniref:hypothetical protein n=1 Tax=Vibrio phage 11895-B1 TaxID=754075 RepID=UPI0002C1276C|nr:hypothetical protein VPHG_00063 [Vibrio phage 11895-B1]AGH32130.1 hypothetical protein VPHG_00063 [Vibrio phage 11895-B1]